MRRIFPPLTATTATGYALGLLIFIRAFFNGALPLMDKTEARYGEIARLMAETGEWVVLQIDYGVPFWAKPPLSTWASALSISLFGAHEFFVRLPYFRLFSLGIFSEALSTEERNSLYISLAWSCFLYLSFSCMLGWFLPILF